MSSIDELSPPGSQNVESEDNVLQNLGYTNQYRRVVSSLSSFSMVLSLANPMSAILLISSYQIIYGGYWGLTWGWFIPAVVFLTQALAVAELCSSMPVNGAFYWWTAYLAPEHLSRPLSFLSGWLNVLQLFTSMASFTFALAQAYTYSITILAPDWLPTNGQTTAIAVGITIVWAALGCSGMEKISILYIVSTAAIIITQVIFIVGLPASHAAQHKPFTKASTVFGDYQNFSDWGPSVAVPTTFFSVAWVVTGWSSPAFIVEETRNARISAPRSIVGSYVVMCIMGWIVCIVSAFCLTDMEAAAADPSGMPLFTLLIQHWNAKIGTAFLLLVFTITLFSGSSDLIFSACQIAAFSRDNGMPYSKMFSRVHQRTNTPVNAVVMIVVGTCIVLMLGFSTSASNIIYELSVIATFLVYLVPITLRLFAGKRFVPGPWHLGRYSIPTHAIALLSMVYMMVMESFPEEKHWTANTFNYNWVVTLGALGLSAILWFTYGKQNFEGIHTEVSVDYQQPKTSSP